MQPLQALTASQDSSGTVKISGDMLECTIKKGGELISGLVRKGTGYTPMTATLVALIEHIEGEDEYDQVAKTFKLSGETREIVLEESGPVRAVVKLKGVHIRGESEYLPFVIRLYFYQGSSQVKIVHTFVYQADEDKDFVKGIAVDIKMGATGELFNRHVGFACETGMFYEGVKGLYTGSGSYRRVRKGRDDEDELERKGQQPINAPLTMDERLAIYEKQVAGQLVELGARENQQEYFTLIDDNAFWNDFRLSQDSCDHYTITKRTTPGCCRVQATQGTRSNGAVFFGSADGVLAASVRDMWQKSPMALEVTGAAGDSPTVSIWLWSRYAQPMDMRRYDFISHFYSYGGVAGIIHQPNGIANTNEIYLNLFDKMPGKQAIWDFAMDSQTEQLLVSDADKYEETGVFGTYWHRVESEEYKNMEKALTGLIHTHIEEVERRKWYGFWDYGDVMHTYDSVRHCWRYDIGGYAWHNTELCNTYVNWLVFLRTGDYDIYKFARAMTRHCSEVDTLHAGKYNMFGSRHDVRHWGGGAKEPRISMAGHNRFYYYLTADERIGDIMDEVKDVDYATLIKDPMQAYFPAHEGFSHIRFGPDWSAFASNWMTRWERFEDEHYRDKLLTGLKCMMEAPLGLSSGSTYHYDPTNGMMYYMGAENPAGHTHLGDGNYQQHMVICFGMPEVMFELAQWLENDELNDQLAQFGAYYAMTPQERNAASGGRFNEDNDETWGGQHSATRMIAYAGERLNNERYIRAALGQLEMRQRMGGDAKMLNDDGRPVTAAVPPLEATNIDYEMPYFNTNGISQWSLNFMETMSILRDYLAKK